MEYKLKNNPAILAGEVRTITLYDDPAVLVREYFINFTKPTNFPSHIPSPPASNPIISLSVQQNEKEVRVSIKNNNTTDAYKVTTIVSDAMGYASKKEGVVDVSGDEIIQSFIGLQAKHSYALSVTGVPVVSGGSSFGPRTYTFKTDFNKPGFVETTGNTPPIIPDPLPPAPPDNPNQTNTPGTTNPNPTAGTIAGAGLTQEQIKADKAGNGLVPCKDTCDFNDILQLVNNLITFLIVTLFAPIIIFLFMYAGYKYLTAEGNPSKIANLKKMVWHIFIGMLLVLCSWLIVKTILVILSSDEVGVGQFLK